MRKRVMTFVELPTKCGCEARGIIWMSVHVCINEVGILNHEGDL